MTGREAALAKSQCESLRRISKDWVDVSASLEAEGLTGRIRDLHHPPSVKKTMRTAGVALAVAPEPFTTVAGIALVAGSFMMQEEPITLKSVAEELRSQMSEISDFDFGDMTISF